MLRDVNFRRSILIFVIALSQLSSDRLDAAITYRVVAAVNDVLPGGYELTLISGFRPPVINNNGRVAFGGRVCGSDGFFGTVLAEHGDALSMIITPGTMAPGPDGPVVLPSAGWPMVFNDAEHLLFHSIIDRKDGLWLERDGELELVAIEGQQVPGAPDGVRFKIIPTWILLNTAGQAVFFAHLTGPGVNSLNNFGVWRFSDGALELVVRTGHEIPGLGPDLVAHHGVGVTPTIDEAGRIVIWVALGGGGTDPPTDDLILRGPPGALKPVVRRGDPAPGAGPGQRFGFFYASGTCNRAGQAVFEGCIVGDGVDDSNDTGLWSEGGGSLHLVAREGDQAPGAPDDVVFDWLGGLPVISNGGHTAFKGRLRGPGVVPRNEVGIWIERAGQLNLVARGGDFAPGTEPEVVFWSLGHFREPLLNALGQVAFQEVLRGPGIDVTNDEGLWVTDLNGDLRLVALEGDELDLGADDIRTIVSLEMRDFSGGGGGVPTSLNDRGELVFWAAFADGSSAVVVAQTVDDLDGDGVPDAEDRCPTENSMGRDADGDGCPDRVEDLAALIDEQGLPKGHSDTMAALAGAAAASVSRGRPNTARRQLEALLSLVDAQRGRRIPDETASLITQFIENAVEELP